MLDRLENVEKRFEEVDEKLCSPGIASDMEQYTKLMKERKQLLPVVEKYREYKEYKKTFEEANELLQSKGLDKDFREMVQEEYENSREALDRCTEELKILLLPKDPNDDKNVIDEIRGGAGGERAHSLRACFSECTQCMQKQRALRPKSSTPMKLSWAAIRKSAL